MVDIDPAVIARLETKVHVDVIVTFDDARTTGTLAGFDVRRAFPAIAAASIRIDTAALQRLTDDPGVVRIELDTEMHALS